MIYEWKDVYGAEGAPPMPVRIIEVKTRTLGLTVPRRPVSGAFPMGCTKKSAQQAL